MTAVPTCPYCNAEVAAPPGLPAGQRVSCPRCGEGFALTRPTEAITLAPSATAAVPPARPDEAAQQAANRLVARVVLGVMLLMAVTGLTYALWTTGFRRANDRGIVKRPSRRPALPPLSTPVPAVAPARLAALAYLPRETSVLAGAHVAELLSSTAGRRLLDQPVRVAGQAVRASSLEAWTGLKLEQIDHVVVGAEAEDRLTPPVHLIVRTREPYDAERVRSALGLRTPLTEETPEGGTRKVYRFTARGGGRQLPMRLWFADDRTLVVGLLTVDLTTVPSRPHRGSDDLPAAVREVLQTRVGPSAPLWAVGHSQDWRKTPAPIALAQAGQEGQLDRLAQVRTFALWLQPGPPLTVHGAVHCVSAEAAQALEEGFLAPQRKAFPELKSVREGAWLTLQLETTLDRLLRGGQR
jgi:hypothetical protein